MAGGETYTVLYERTTLSGMALRNFKPFRNVELTFGAITLLYGLNSSGKSSILQALRLLADSVPRILGNGQLPLLALDGNADLGAFGEVLNRSSQERLIGFDLEFTTPQVIERPSGETEVVRLTTAFGIDFDDELRPTAVRLSPPAFRADDDAELRFTFLGPDGASGEMQLDTANSDVPTWPSNPAGPPRFQANGAFPGAAIETDPAGAATWDTLRRSSERVLRSWAASLRHVEGIRPRLPRSFVHRSDRPVANAIEWFGSGEIDNARDATNRWLEDAGVDTELAVLELSSPHVDGPDLVQVGVRSGGRFFDLRDVGTGIGQLLPVVLEVYRLRSGTLLVEQPELHLHPRLQAELAEAFQARVVSDLDDQAPAVTKFVIETHSEHLANRLLAKVRDGRLDPDDLALLWVEPGGTVRRLEVLASGDLAGGWPTGFFDPDIEERLVRPPRR